MVSLRAEDGGLVEIKGWRNGLLLILPPHGEWDSLVASVDARFDEGRGRAFWRGSQVTLDLGARQVDEAALDALVDRLKAEFALVPVAVVAQDAATRAVAEKLVLTAYEVLPTVQKPSEVAARVAEPEKGPALPPGATTALYLPTTVRSGQRIVHDGSIIVSGDVNAGSEVFATGDILVFGTLRGLAHAGYEGNEGARIVALSLRPPQLRIAGKIARSPEEEPKGGPTKRGAEVARIEGGEIGVFPL